jgi:multiple sugar transport system substrate-binding protein
LPLEEYLPQEYLEDQQANSIGCSHESYHYKGHQWALAIDAATPVASYRKDLFEKEQRPLPENWNDIIILAREKKLALPAIPIDLLMNFYMFCLAHGSEPFQSKEEVVDRSTGLQALETMRELYSLVDRDFFQYNPIAVAERMSKTNDFLYCPFAYGYSNYSRSGFAKYLLHYTDLVSFSPGKKLRSTIGGTGIAVSSSCKNREWAIRFAQEIVSPECQRTFYAEHGGQPGHGSAWNDEHANRLCQDYFRQVLPAMERGYIRPRYNGYLHFQDEAGQPVQNFLMNGGNAVGVLENINRLYQQSLAHVASA